MKMVRLNIRARTRESATNLFKKDMVEIMY